VPGAVHWREGKGYDPWSPQVAGTVWAKLRMKSGVSNNKHVRCFPEPDGNVWTFVNHKSDFFRFGVKILLWKQCMVNLPFRIWRHRAIVFPPLFPLRINSVSPGISSLS
jgi:hypothetical protein